jgi:parallel beta-helix repeat protein
MYYANVYLTIASILATASMSLATTIHVPTDQPTIQAGIDAAVDGDTVLVTDGIYIGEGNSDIDFLGKSILVVSEYGPDLTIIDCEGSYDDPHRAFSFHSGEDSTSILQGFTIKGGYYNGNWPSDDGIIFCNASSPIIRGNIFTENQTLTSICDGIYCLYSSPTIDGNTFSQNYGSVTIYCYYAPATITNCILWNNQNWDIVAYYGEPIVRYCDFEEGYGFQGEGNINEDPLFVYAEGNDYHLSPNSPCIDVGDPESSPDPDGTIADMGCLYYDHDSEITFYIMRDKFYFPRLDSVGFYAFVANNTDTSISLQGWTECETPWGLILSPLLGPVNAIIGANRYFYSYYFQRIPESAPYGFPYTYRVSVGEYPNSILSQDFLRFVIGPPRLTMQVVPDTTIFHRGEMLRCTATIVNPEDIRVDFQIWSEVETPGGHIISPAYGPIDRTIEHNTTLGQQISQQIPNNAPYGGPYIYTVRVGIYGEEMLAEDSFEFFIVP